MVSRRTVLQSLGAATTTGLLSGCVSQGEFSNGGGSPVQNVSVSTFHAGQGECTPKESGSIEIQAVPNNAQRFLVDGTFIAPNPCHTAEVESATYDAESDTATITITTRSTGGACADCLAAVTYSGAIEFSGGTPGTIRIEHAGESDSASTEFSP